MSVMYVLVIIILLIAIVSTLLITGKSDETIAILQREIPQI
ncbi:hypothetical protein V7075_28305 [Neobacillus drentensis]